MNATEIDTLIEELQRAKAEGAELVVLQLNQDRRGLQCLPRFGFHDPNMSGVYVVGGDHPPRWMPA